MRQTNKHGRNALASAYRGGTWTFHRFSAAVVRATGHARAHAALGDTYAAIAYPSIRGSARDNFLGSGGRRTRGRFAEADRDPRQAQELDPLPLIANAASGLIYLNAGRCDDAVLKRQSATALNAKFALALLWVGMADGERGRLDRSAAHAILASLERKASAGGYAPAYEPAMVHLALGDRDAALASLGRAVKERAHSMVFLAIDPQFAPLRADPRFKALRDRVEQHQGRAPATGGMPGRRPLRSPRPAPGIADRATPRSPSPP